jgi:hypothetical protein
MPFYIVEYPREYSMRRLKRLAELSALLIAFVCGAGLIARGQSVPHYRVDPSFPKEMPHNWIMSHVEHLFVDANDHIWVFQEPNIVQPEEAGLAQKPPLSECCIPAPAVIEFDSEGNTLNAYGPGVTPGWPTGATGVLWIDKKGNFWTTGGGRRPGAHVPRPETADTQIPWNRRVIEISKEGKILLEIGRVVTGPEYGHADNQDTSLLFTAGGVQFDEDAHEVYISDGYINRRIVVYDSDTGKFKRGWGAYGMPLSEIKNATFDDDPVHGRPVNLGQDYNPANPPEKQFRGPLVGLRLSNDGLLYVSDREDDRVQVFTKQGKFVKEFIIAPKTLDEGSPMDLAFSSDPQQKYLLVGDGSNNIVWILNRGDGSVVTTFGHRGHNAGQFSYLHAIDMDSHGNIYTGEVKYNNRIQKFVPVK